MHSNTNRVSIAAVISWPQTRWRQAATAAVARSGSQIARSWM
jgi:hypothetical protein